MDKNTIIMRNLLKRAAGLLMLAAMAVVPSAKSSAQQVQQLPLDPAVVSGTLPNGLTYYIRHNERPKGQADFYIAQRVGSILEAENQRGLAHFLEHMCFNGTTHFPGKNLITWLESVGVKFGYNLNAYTSIDETVYNISNVPVAREGVQDSCLLILHDWANDLLLLPEEIDAERAVIHEEWRTSNVGQMRILDKLLPVIYPGSRYGHRLPIGTMEVVDNFPHQALRDYYETWYRPDQQGIVVVGDIDPARIEAKIKEMFADIEMPADAPVRFYEPVPDHDGTIIAIGHDSEMQFPLAMMTWKSDRMPAEMRNSPIYYANEYVESMIASMLNERMSDIANKPGSPFAQSSVDFGDYFLAKTANGFSLTVLAHKPEEMAAPLAAGYREVLRAARGGFTPSEYERARSRYLANLEQAYTERDARTNDQFVQTLVRHFIDTVAAPDIEVEYQYGKMLAQSIDVNAVNQAMAQTVADTNNRIVMVLMPDLPSDAGADYPTEQSIASALAAVDAETIEAKAEENVPEALVEALPAPGSIVKEQTDPRFDATVWTLSNGATVVLRPSSLRAGEILFRGIAKGGTAWLPDSLAPELTLLDYAISSAGLGKLTNSNLGKYLAGKKAELEFQTSDYSRLLRGNATPADLRYLMELIYMTMTDVNFDSEEMEAFRAQLTAILHNQESTPEYKFQQTVSSDLYSSPKKQPLSQAAVELASVDRLSAITKGLTANAADYTFIFAGDFSVDSIRPLVEQYIASLPGDAATSTASQEVKLNPALGIYPGTKTQIANTEMQSPQTYAFVLQWAEMPYDLRNSQLASIAGQILSNRLLDLVREKEGAVYSIFAQGSMSPLSNQNTTIVSSFPMKPEKRDRVLEIIADQIADMGNAVEPTELAKAKEYMSKQYAADREENSGWLRAMSGAALSGVDTLNGAVESLDTITEADVASFVKAMAGQGNFRVVILEPAPAAESAE